jgi:hypothetical protein
MPEQKRTHEGEDAEAAAVKGALLAMCADATERAPSAIAAALRQPNASLLDAGITSAVGVSLRSRVFKELEAELTLHELLTTPVASLISLILDAKRRDQGAVIPELRSDARR